MILSKSWTDNRLINLNTVKWKTVSYGRNVENIYHYSINKTELENTAIESIKDLGVTFDTRLKFSLRIN